MRLLKCKLCNGEADIISNDKLIYKKIKCRKCGISNNIESEQKSPEIIIIRKTKKF